MKLTYHYFHWGRVFFALIVFAFLAGLLWLAPLKSASASLAPVSSGQTACYWELVDVQPNIATGSEAGMSATYGSGYIETSYTSSGVIDCNDTTFRTSHTWDEPGGTLVPGEILSFSVSLSWDLDGSPSCSTLTAGARTSISDGKTRIEAGQSKIIVSREPSNSVSNSGEIVIPQGSNKGATYRIQAYGVEGGLGGTVNYNYTYVCEEEPTATVEVDCTPDIHLPQGLKPGDDLSPSATFYDSQGNEVIPIGHAWFFDGVESYSVVWDGNETKIELQYTCPNHRGGYQTVIFPAYGESPPPGAPSQPEQPAGPAGQPPSASQPKAPGISSNQVKMGAGGAMVAVGVIGGIISSIITLINIFSKPKVAPVKITRSGAGRPAPSQQAPAAEGSGYRRDTIDDANNAGDWLSGKIGEGSEYLNDIKDKIEQIPIDDKAKEMLTGPLEKGIEYFEKTKKAVDKAFEPVKKVMEVRKNVREVAKQWEQNKQFGEEMRKDLQNLPEGTKNQITDMSRTVDGVGRGLGKALNFVPGYKALGGEETFEVQKSFNEAARGLEKTMKGIHHSDSEMKELGMEKEYQDKPSIYDDPQYQDLQRQLKNTRPQEPGVLDKAWEFFKGKPVDPNVIQFR